MALLVDFYAGRHDCESHSLAQYFAQIIIKPPAALIIFERHHAVPVTPCRSRYVPMMMRHFGIALISYAESNAASVLTSMIENTYLGGLAAASTACQRLCAANAFAR